MNVWSLVGGRTYLGRIRKYDLVGEGVSLGGNLEVSKAHIIPS